jgi:SAM-dependent methyltransferase
MAALVQKSVNHTPNSLKNSGIVMLHSSKYNEWQYEQLKKYVGDRVLEIGCGLGNITQYLVHDAEYVLGVDIKPEAIDFTRSRLPFASNLHTECVDIFEEMPSKFVGFDTIVFSNVLEHIADDQRAMRICHEILRTNHGHLLLLVPAHKFLFGTLDKESGHLRRYRKKDIVKLAIEANFSIVDLYLFNALGALGWYLNYCLMKRKNTNEDEESLQVRLFDRWLVPLARRLESRIRPIIGLSHILILRAI